MPVNWVIAAEQPTAPKAMHPLSRRLASRRPTTMRKEGKRKWTTEQRSNARPCTRARCQTDYA